jgi:hypothetical protein
MSGVDVTQQLRQVFDDEEPRSKFFPACCSQRFLRLELIPPSVVRLRDEGIGS